MSKLIRLFLLLWVVLAGYRFIAYLSISDNWIIISTVTILGIGFLVSVVKERWRRKKEGYFVYKRGGAEDGLLIYDERGNALQLYFNRQKDTIYVPTDVEWDKVMPHWARERKQEIVTRIKARIGKRLIGKNWTYEETDKPELVIRNS
jgi:hypothetical protein